MIVIRIEPTYDSDVVVVGAGPAGASAAAHMARAGLRVILIDQQRFPRDKACGDFQGPIALLELQRLGVSSRSEYRATNIIRQAALHLDGVQLISTAIPLVGDLPAYGRCVPRKTLDAWIVDAARMTGAEVCEGLRLSDFRVEPDGVALTVKGAAGTQQLRTRLLVGADGSSSLVSRFLRGHQVPSGDRIIAIRAYFEDVEGDPSRTDLYFTGDSFPGYYWLFPTGRTTANVGVGMMLETVPPVEEHLHNLLLRLIEQDAALHARLARAKQVGKVVGWPLTTYNPRLPITGERVMLVGDAAGLINSLNGEGVQNALLSGRWAAEVAAACVVENNFSASRLVAYAERVEEELGYDMALAGMIVQLIRNRSLNPVWLEALRIIVARARLDPVYADIAGGILAGIVPANRAISSKMIMGTLEQAAISLGFGAIRNLINGPAQLTNVGRKSFQTGLAIAYETAQQPVDTTRWGIGVAAAAAELAGHVARHASEQSRRADSTDQASEQMPLAAS